MHVTLHLTDDTELRAHGFVYQGQLFAEVRRDFPIPDNRLGHGTSCGPPPPCCASLPSWPSRRPGEAEEDACWQAHQAATAAAAAAAAAADRGRVA